MAIVRNVLCVTLCVHLVMAYIDKNVFQCLTDYNLISFSRLIRDANLESSLTGAGPFTILAPSNDAIANLDVDMMTSLEHSPYLLKQIVRYHMISAFKVVPHLLVDKILDSIEGQPLHFLKIGLNVSINNESFIDAEPNSDIVCNNGIIHIIDSVLIPPIFSTTNLAAVLVMKDNLFRDFFMGVLLSNQTHVIEHGEYTIFAPVDEAFGRYSQLNNLRPEMPNVAKIYQEIIKYHLVPGSRTSAKLQNGQRLYTLHGSPITVISNSNGLMVDNAVIINPDIAASNGVIHAIDHVLFPVDLLKEFQNHVG